MNIVLTDRAKADIAYWNRTDPSKTSRIKALIKNIMDTPYAGIGKPEPLKFDLSGYYSRRIDREHRIVYKVDGENIIIVQCRFH